MEEMKKRFRSSRKAYRSIKKRATDAAMTWEWASGPLFDPRPYWFERMGLEQGRTLPAKPRKADGAFEYGYDSEARAVVIREGTSFSGAFYEEFVAYSEEAVEGWLFDYGPDKELLNVTRQTFEEGELTRFELFGEEGFRVETYEREGGRVTRIRVQGAEDDDLELTATYEIAYESTGRARRIEKVYPGGERETVWKAR